MQPALLASACSFVCPESGCCAASDATGGAARVNSFKASASDKPIKNVKAAPRQNLRSRLKAIRRVFTGIRALRKRCDYMQGLGLLKLEFECGKSGDERLAGIDLPQAGAGHERRHPSREHNVFRKWRAIDKTNAIVGAYARFDIRLEEQQL